MNATTQRAGWSVLLCLALCAGPTPTDAAFSTAQTDILGLRLGMTEPAVMENLLRQGITPGRIGREASACRMPTACAAILTAPARDGALTISLRGDPLTVDRITYRLQGRAPGQALMIEDSALQHFGPPDQREPMAWCRRPGASGVCPEDQPALRFNRDTLTLVLSAGVLSAGAQDRR